MLLWTQGIYVEGLVPKLKIWHWDIGLYQGLIQSTTYVAAQNTICKLNNRHKSIPATLCYIKDSTTHVVCSHTVLIAHRHTRQVLVQISTTYHIVLHNRYHQLAV